MHINEDWTEILYNSAFKGEACKLNSVSGPKKSLNDWLKLLWSFLINKQVLFMFSPKLCHCVNLKSNKRLECISKNTLKKNKHLRSRTVDIYVANCFLLLLRCLRWCVPTFVCWRVTDRVRFWDLSLQFLPVFLFQCNEKVGKVYFVVFTALMGHF